MNGWRAFLPILGLVAAGLLAFGALRSETGGLRRDMERKVDREVVDAKFDAIMDAIMELRQEMRQR